MTAPRNWLRVLVKGFLRVAFRIYYRSIQVQGMELVPREGPVLLVANHPNSLLDPAILVRLLPRPVHLGAKHTLFTGPLRSILTAFGAIPLVRAQDEHRAMHRNLAALDRYETLLRECRIAAIFPEGLSQDDPRVATLKTGAARIALQAESSLNFQLSLRILPVGLQFEPRRRFRADAFARFGEPFKIGNLAQDYAENPRRTVRLLTNRIEASLQRLAFHVENPEQIPFVERIVDVYVGRVRRSGLAGVDWRGIRGELLHKTADCLNYFGESDPAAVSAVEHRLKHYERLRETAGINPRLLEEPSLLLSGPLAPIQAVTETVLGALPALFGFVTGAVPYYLTRALSRHIALQKRHFSALSLTHILAGAIAFPLTYAVEIWWVWKNSSDAATLVFSALLVPAGLFALFYLHRVRKLAVHLGGRAAGLLKLEAVARVATERHNLLDLLDHMRDRYRVEVLGWDPLKGARAFKI